MNIDRYFNTLGPRQNGRNFAEDIFKFSFSYENVTIEWISLFCFLSIIYL